MTAQQWNPRTATSEHEAVWQARRILIGHCPTCGTPTVVLNNHEVWPYISCICGASFPTGAMRNECRIEEGSLVVRRSVDVMQHVHRLADAAYDLENGGL